MELPSECSGQKAPLSALVYAAPFISRTLLGANNNCAASSYGGVGIPFFGDRERVAVAHTRRLPLRRIFAPTYAHPQKREFLSFVRPPDPHQGGCRYRGRKEKQSRCHNGLEKRGGAAFSARRETSRAHSAICILRTRRFLFTRREKKTRSRLSLNPGVSERQELVQQNCTVLRVLIAGTKLGHARPSGLHCGANRVLKPPLYASLLECIMCEIRNGRFASAACRSVHARPTLPVYSSGESAYGAFTAQFHTACSSLHHAQFARSFSRYLSLV